MDTEDILIKTRAPQESIFAQHHPEIYKEVLKGPGRTWPEKLYLYINKGQVARCPVCGSELTFRGFKTGYASFCSSACSNKYNAGQVKCTKLSRYGTTGYNNRAKSTQTCLERYGCENPSQTQEARAKLSKPKSETLKQKLSKVYWSRTVSQKTTIQAKRSATNLQRFGANNPMQNDELREKAKQTLIANHGTDVYARMLKLSNKTKREATISKYPEVIGHIEGRWLCACPHKDCNKCTEKQYLTDPEIHRGRIKYNSELCTKLLPVGSQNEGTSIELFVRNILDEHGIEYIANSYSIISPKSIDIYIPSRNIGIECNGVYWHCSEHKGYKDHYSKFKICQAHNIQLITLWEDWIVNTPEKVKSLILNKLGLTQHKYYARKCQIKEVPAREANMFLDNNHIQGRCKSKIRLGLYHDGSLVAVMCFNRRSALSGGKNDNAWELIRYCNDLNSYVAGGASRLLKYFITHFKPSKIVSFSSNDISTGALYKALGFQKDNESVGYWYIKKGTILKRYHRSTFTKSNIIKAGLAPADKSSWTESSVMQTLPYYKIYDSGTTRWVLQPTILY